MRYWMPECVLCAGREKAVRICELCNQMLLAGLLDMSLSYSVYYWRTQCSMTKIA